MKRAVTITEIAQESGVSIATVSRVLNQNPRVAPETRKRVEEVIEKYEYSPSDLARGMVNKKTMMIGVVIPDISNPYFAAMFNEIEQSAHDAGYSVFLCNTMFTSDSKHRQEYEYFRMMLDKKVDGVLIIGGQIDLEEVCSEYVSHLKHMASLLPVVVIGRKIDDAGDCIFIQKENGGGVSTAVSYLAAMGHRRIAFVGGEKGVTITESRLKAYKIAVSALSLVQDESLISLSDYYAKDGYNAAVALLAENIKFTAVIAINDAVAKGVIRALNDNNMNVPDDIALISCDQFIDAEYNMPSLTSIDQKNELFGRMVIQSLLCAIKGVGEPAVLNFTSELIVRESSGGLVKAEKIHESNSTVSNRKTGGRFRLSEKFSL